MQISRHVISKLLKLNDINLSRTMSIPNPDILSVCGSSDFDLIWQGQCLREKLWNVDLSHVKFAFLSYETVYLLHAGLSSSELLINYLCCYKEVLFIY